MFILEGGHAIRFAAAIIIAIQYTLTECSAILGEAGIKIIIIRPILGRKIEFRSISKLLNLHCRSRQDFHIHCSLQGNPYDKDMLN